MQRALISEYLPGASADARLSRQAVTSNPIHRLPEEEQPCRSDIPDARVCFYHIAVGRIVWAVHALIGTNRASGI